MALQRDRADRLGERLVGRSLHQEDYDKNRSGGILFVAALRQAAFALEAGDHSVERHVSQTGIQGQRSER
ncbi:MAG: hypothetical protein H7Y16_06255 [Candidatus Parcubacteria bacterium]|nr:hypothetical protein [Burkholderiales bacterium]